MSRLVLFISALLLALSFSVANAGAHKSKQNRKADGTAAEQVDKSSRKNQGGREDDNDEDSEDHDDDSEDHDHDSEDHDDDEDDVLEGSAETDDEVEKGKRGKSAGKGNERSQEMRERRDERKEIKEEYRAGREAGDESGEISGDADVGEKPAKKPWWKFWEGEE